MLVFGIACGPAAIAIPPAPPVDIRMNGNIFSKTEISIPKGGSVQWTNDSSVAHTVTFTDALRLPTDNGRFSKKVEVAGVVARSFPAGGTYFFFCMIHPSMQGQITVGP